MQSITIDRSKRLKDQPHTGHNRWHPDIPPLLAVEPGEEVVLETRDASDCQIQPQMTVADLVTLDAKVAHPLTGPVYIKGAKPGDLLEIEYLDIVPQPHGWTRNRPGAGFLRDVFTEPYLVHWDIKDGWATSPQIPGVRIPNGSFMGTAGIAPSHAQVEAWTRREAALVGRGGIAFLPDPQDAVQPRALLPRRACARCRHAKTAATWMRSSSPKARGCSFRSMWTVPCTLLVMATLHREIRNAVSPPSRWALPRWCAFVSMLGKPHATISAGHALRILAILLLQSGRRRVISLPPWGCPSARTAPRKAKI